MYAEVSSFSKHISKLEKSAGSSSILPPRAPGCCMSALSMQAAVAEYDARLDAEATRKDANKAALAKAALEKVDLNKAKCPKKDNARKKDMYVPS
jgi:hypothetical protein